MTDLDLCRLAQKSAQTAYAPYSNYKVGAALLCKNGKIYTGCNIENAAFSPTVCAERTAFFKAISEGEKEFVAIAIAGGKDGKITAPASPCGVCRQVMAEFCDPDTFRVLLVNEKDFSCHTLSALLPFGFGKNDLS